MRKSGLGSYWDSFRDKALAGDLFEKTDSTDIEIDFTDFEASLTEPQKYFYDSTENMNLFFSGQGGGKTYVAGGIAAKLVTKFPSVRGLICANTVKQLTQSTMTEMRRVWRTEFALKEYDKKTKEGDYVVGIKPPESFAREEHDLDDYNGVISFRNGGVIFLRTLENYKAIDGMTVGWAILDETKDTRKEAVQEVVLGRIRQQGLYLKYKDITDQVNDRAFNPVYIITSPAKVSWINEMFNLDKHELEIKAKIYDKNDYFKKRDKYNSSRIIIASAWFNSRNLPAGHIEQKMKFISKHLINLLVWSDPFSPEGGEFYKGFDRGIHVSQKTLPYDPNAKLMLTFDFNVNPYITLLEIQLHIMNDRIFVFVLDEMCLPNPNNSTPALCEKINRKYRTHTEGCEILGDPAGRAKNTRVDRRKEPDKADDYKIIMKQLKRLRPKLLVSKKAAGVSSRGNFINSVFETNFAGIVVLIDKKCKNLIVDLEGVKEAKDGTKHKQTVKDTVTGVTYEKYGHTSDAFDYFMTQKFSKEYKKFIKGYM